MKWLSVCLLGVVLVTAACDDESHGLADILRDLIKDYDETKNAETKQTATKPEETKQEAIKNEETEQETTKQEKVKQETKQDTEQEEMTTKSQQSEPELSKGALPDGGELTSQMDLETLRKRLIVYLAEIEAEIEQRKLKELVNGIKETGADNVDEAQVWQFIKSKLENEELND